MRVTSLMDEARRYQALPVTAKTIDLRRSPARLTFRIRGSEHQIFAATPRHVSAGPAALLQESPARE
jgi:hypothetical protein